MSQLAVTIDGHTFQVELRLLPQSGSEITVLVDGQPHQVSGLNLNDRLETFEWLIVDGRPYEILFDRDLGWISSARGLHRVQVQDREASTIRPQIGDGRIKAPIPGQITRVLVAPGQSVSSGDPLLILEAMKMENEIRAPRAGIINALHIEPGQSVLRHEVLLEIT